MRKILSLLILFLFLISGCSNGNNKDIPPKNNATDNDAMLSPINTKNIDQYMFRDDVQYVDLRNSESVLNDGYIAGFEFIPYYSVIASFSEHEALFQMKSNKDDSGKTIHAGQVGGFVAQYEESEKMIENLFSKEKYIFLISIGGSESAYLINLLLQLGYNGELLYNIGGVSNNDGVESYTNISSNKYYIKGHPGIQASVEYGFLDNLTPINCE